MIVIPIVVETLPIITELNNGVRPQFEEGRTYFVYYHDSPPRIIDQAEWYELKYNPSMCWHPTPSIFVLVRPA
jgi:hypothetical protein